MKALNGNMKNEKCARSFGLKKVSSVQYLVNFQSSTFHLLIFDHSIKL